MLSPRTRLSQKKKGTTHFELISGWLTFFDLQIFGVSLENREIITGVKPVKPRYPKLFRFGFLRTNQKKPCSLKGLGHFFSPQFSNLSPVALGKFVKQYLASALQLFFFYFQGGNHFQWRFWLKRLSAVISQMQLSANNSSIERNTVYLYHRFLSY